MFGGKKKREKVELSKESYQKAKQLLGYMKPYKVKVAIGLSFLLLSSVIGLVFPLLLGSLLGAEKTGVGMSAINSSEVPLEELIKSADVIAGLLFIAFGIQAIFSFFRIVIFSSVTEKVLATIRQEAFKKLTHLPVHFYTENKVGELNSRVSSDVSLMQETFNTTFAEFFRQLVIITGSLVVLLTISVKMSLVMLASLPVMIIIAIVFGKFIRRISKEAQEKVADSNGLLEEVLNGITVVKAFTREAFELKRYANKTNEVRDLYIKNAKWRGAFVSFIIFCMMGSIVFVIWYGIQMQSEGVLGGQEFYAFMMTSVFLGASIGSLPDLYGKIQKTIGASERLMDLLGEDEEHYEGKVLNEGKESHWVSLKKVSFHYPNRAEKLVLKDIDFNVPVGSKIALVGASGSGKSTIAKLLMRFYPVNDGEILIKGQNINELDLGDLRNKMAYVPQEVMLFGGSVRDNIAYGAEGKSEEEILKAADKANALEFIEQLPEGLDTTVGAKGLQLSGGQRQRIAIARAILKDPEFLILDEATSALDTESEKLVQDALEKLMENRTSIVIAHRLSTIKNADAILVMNQGKIVEQGSHQELLNMEAGYYKSLNENQLV